jgi:multiple sugar transport system permease protein
MADVAAPPAVAAQKMAKRRRLSLEAIEERWFYVFISPWLIGFVLWTAGPMVASVILSFTRYEIVLPPQWIGFDNFVTMFTKDPLFWKALKVTLHYTILSVPLSVVFAVLIALLLNQRLPGLSVWRTVYYLPSITSGVAVALMWSWVFHPNFGLVNSVLWMLFKIQGPKWLLDEAWVIPTFVIMGLWGFGGPMLIYLAAMQGIPTELYESAELDGANILQKIRHITIPLITPVIFFNMVMNIIGSFQVFTNAFIITAGGPNYASYFYLLHLYSNGFQYFRMGYASALALVLFVIIMVCTYVAFRTSRYWVYYEAGPLQGGRR